MGDSASDNAMQAAGIEGLPIRQNPKGKKELDLRKLVDLYLQLV